MLFGRVYLAVSKKSLLLAFSFQLIASRSPNAAGEEYNCLGFTPSRRCTGGTAIKLAGPKVRAASLKPPKQRMSAASAESVAPNRQCYIREPDRYQILRIIMTRYFFHVSNSPTFTDKAGKDPIGQQFPDPEHTKAHATRIAREIAQDDDWDGYSVVVVDEHGNEIARVPIQD